MIRIAPDDYVEVMNLYALYNLCSDAGDPEGYADCFSSTGRMEVVNGGTMEGRDNFIEFKKRDFGGRAHLYRRHWNGSVHLEQLADGSIRGRCYLHAYMGAPGEVPATMDAGVYEDILVKEGGFWKFALRRLSIDANTYKIREKDAAK